MLHFCENNKSLADTNPRITKPSHAIQSHFITCIINVVEKPANSNSLVGKSTWRRPSHPLHYICRNVIPSLLTRRSRWWRIQKKCWIGARAQTPAGGCEDARQIHYFVSFPRWAFAKFPAGGLTNSRVELKAHHSKVAIVVSIYRRRKCEITFGWLY